MDKKILDKVLSGLSDRNIRFNDLLKLLSDFGFSQRTKGDHHIFYREGVEEIINLQIGDIIQLDSDVKSPINVEIGGIPRFKAYCGKRGEQSAIQLNTPILDD